jgi:hypothetical protein
MIRALRSGTAAFRLLLASAIVMPAVAAGQILPVARGTEWNPGVPGEIPNRTAICARVDASTYGNGASDATGGIQAAIDSCPAGQVVQLSAGTFRLAAGPLSIQKGITLRGEGPNRTTLQKPDGTGQPTILIGERYARFAGSTNLTANAVKGARSVTVASTAGLTVGQLVLIDQLTNPAISFWSSDCDANCKGWFSRSDRSLTQMMEVASISGNTITFTTPFHINFETAFSAQLTRYSSPAVKFAGVENLKAYGGEGGDDGGNFLINLTAYTWLKNVESHYSSGAAFHLYQSLQSEIRDSYFRETKNPNPGGSGYGMDISRASSDNLIENNISWWFNKVIVMRAAGGGNVVAYNYFEDGFGAGYKTYIETGLNASHMTTSHNVLFEGNQAWNFGADGRWGNAVYITFFRNHATTLRRDVNRIGLRDDGPRTGADIYARHYWYSFIGNVLGFQGMTPSPGGNCIKYQNTDSGSCWPIWQFGVTTAWSGISGIDTQVAGTALRQGNFDYYTNQVRWDTTAQAIPNSMYLTSKPAFFGNCTWPWVDPTGSTKLHVLPARARFDGNPNACGSASVPSAPTQLRAQ